MQVVLAMFRADGERRSFSIFRDMTVIGRREDCDLRIPLGEVSRKHCRIIKDGDTIRLEDLGSSNGTFHNNERVQEAIIGPGDAIRVGPVTFLVQIDGVPSDEELVPPENPEGTATSDVEVAELPLDAEADPLAQLAQAIPGAEEEAPAAEEPPAEEAAPAEEETPIEEEAAAAAEEETPAEEPAPTAVDAAAAEPAEDAPFEVQLDTEEQPAADDDDLVEFEPDETSNDQPA